MTREWKIAIWVLFGTGIILACILLNNPLPIALQTALTWPAEKWINPSITNP